MSDVEKALAAHGFELVRHKKHRVWRDENGRTIVTPSSPSDRRWEGNAISTLSRILGVKKHDLLSRAPRRVPTVGASLPVDSIVSPSQLEALVIEPSTPSTPVALYTKAEQKKLRRLFKHEQDRAKRHAEQLARFGDLAVDCACYRLDLIAAGDEPIVAYLRAALEANKRLHRWGFRDAYLTVAMILCPCSGCRGEVYDMPIPLVPMAGRVRHAAINLMTGEAKATDEWVDEVREHKFKCVLMPNCQVEIVRKAEPR